MCIRDSIYIDYIFVIRSNGFRPETDNKAKLRQDFVLIGQLVYLSALHPLQLTIDDKDKTMRMGRMCVAGSNVDGGSVLPPSV